MAGGSAQNNLYTPITRSDEVQQLLQSFGWTVTTTLLPRHKKFWLIGRYHVPQNPLRRLWSSFRLNENKFWVHINSSTMTQVLTYRPDLPVEVRDILNTFLLPYGDPRREPDVVLTMEKQRNVGIENQQ